jgi:hypothetical protein
MNVNSSQRGAGDDRLLQEEGDYQSGNERRLLTEQRGQRPTPLGGGRLLTPHGAADSSPTTLNPQAPGGRSQPNPQAPGGGPNESALNPPGEDGANQIPKPPKRTNFE